MRNNKTGSLASAAARHVIDNLQIKQCGDDRYYRDIGRLRKYYNKEEILKLIKRVAGL